MAPFHIEDDILNLFEGSKMHTFYVSQIEKMFLVRRKVINASGLIGKLLRHFTDSYKLHIIAANGEKTVIQVEAPERQAFIGLISKLRKENVFSK